MNYIFLAVALLLVGGLLFVVQKFFTKALKLLLKGLSFFLALAFVIRYFCVNGSLFNAARGLNFNTPFSPALSFFVILFVWLMFASVVILWLTPFFNFPILRNYAKTFSLGVSVFSAGFLQQIAYSFTGSYALTLCGAFLAVEIGTSIALSVFYIFQDKGFKISKKNWLEMLAALPIVLIFSAPPYLFNTFFGLVGSGYMLDLKIFHRIYLYLAFVFLFGMYFLLRNKNREFSRMVLLYISFVTLISYCYDYDFSNILRPWSWPLHLCNTAMFIIPLCLCFKWEKLFYFTLFINVLGAFLAMLMPNYSAELGFFSHQAVRFWINHIMAFAMPILIVLLGVYRRPNLRLFIYSMIGFLIYFLLVLVLNAWFSNYGVSVDYFFLNSDFIADKLGLWAENIRDNFVWTFSIGSLSFTFYPLYQVLFFIVYFIFGLSMWFLYTYLFQIQDFYIALAEKRKKIKIDEIAMCVKYGKKEIEDCMNENSVGKLVVNGVSKRYGNNKVYSVKDASFEVKAGEILGFLGPNGAGKSTIIKCIVGIQPPTNGSIEINGFDIEKQPVQAKEQFGFVPDHYALYEKLSGREYINYIADLYGVERAIRDERMAKLLKDLSMEKNIDNQIRTYSHGMKQKITIMSALIHNPKLWILDEPLTGLDPNSIFEVKECMRNHAKEGNIVFFSSHIIDIVEKLCDRIIIIKKGRIITSVTLDELKKKNIPLEKFYLDIINAEDDQSDMAFVEEQKVEQPESKFFEIKKKEKSKKREKHGKNAKEIENENSEQTKLKEKELKNSREKEQKEKEKVVVAKNSKKEKEKKNRKSDKN